MNESRIEAILSKKTQDIELLYKEKKPVSVVEIVKVLGHNNSHIFYYVNCRNINISIKGYDCFSIFLLSINDLNRYDIDKRNSRY